METNDLSSDFEDDLFHARKQLLSRINGGTQEPKGDVKRLSVKDVITCEAVFQHRGTNLGAREAHIKELVKALKRNSDKPLAPITVYWIGDGYCCIDGHHRLAAYGAVGYKAKIPVTVFKGTLDEAIAAALRSNSKDKLSMSGSEKTEAAWRLVLSTQLSKAAITSAANVSERTVGYMRATQKQLLKDYQESYIAGLRWHEAIQVAKGMNPREDKDLEDYLYQKKLALANRLSKHFGKTLVDNCEVFLGGVEIYSPKLMESINEWFGVHPDDIDDTEEEEEHEF